MPFPHTWVCACPPSGMLVRVPCRVLSSQKLVSSKCTVSWSPGNRFRKATEDGSQPGGVVGTPDVWPAGVPCSLCDYDCSPGCSCKLQTPCSPSIQVDSGFPIAFVDCNLY